MSDSFSVEIIEKPINKDSVVGNRLFIAEQFPKAAKELEVEGIARFEGFYASDYNDRSRASTYRIGFNERLVDNISQEEVERDMYHELQHIRNHAIEAELPDYHRMGDFVYNPKFKDMFLRMKSHFDRHKETGYPFGKTVPDKPDRGGFGFTYTEPDELLALLRGYDRYVKQKEVGKEIKTEPYEFIDAFIPDDLEFLDYNNRLKLAETTAH